MDVGIGRVVHRRKEKDSLADTTELVVVFPDERKSYWLGKNSRIVVSNDLPAEEASDVDSESL